MHPDKNSETAEIKPLLDPNTQTVNWGLIDFVCGCFWELGSMTDW